MLRRKPYILLLVAAFMMLVHSFVSQTSESIVINIHDTYYVIAFIHWYQLYSVFILLLACIYLILDKVKINLYFWLSFIHIIGTIMLFFIINYYNYMHSLEYCSPTEIFERQDYSLYLNNSLIAILSLQFLFFINIFVSIIEKWRASSASQ